MSITAGRLAGRKILIVGAGTRPNEDPDAPPGNGRAIAVAAAREGATVACADIDIKADVSDPAACGAMVHEAVDLSST